MKTADYIAAVKAKRNITSDYKVAKALGISTQLMSRYVKGISVPGPLVAFKVAEILGDQPYAVLADFEAERAEKMGKADDVAEWQGIIKKLAGGAMSVLLAAGMFFSPNADARLRADSGVESNAHRIQHRIGSGSGKKRRRRSSKAPDLALV